MPPAIIPRAAIVGIGRTNDPTGPIAIICRCVVVVIRGRVPSIIGGSITAIIGGTIAAVIRWGIAAVITVARTVSIRAGGYAADHRAGDQSARERGTKTTPGFCWSRGRYRT